MRSPGVPELLAPGVLDFSPRGTRKYGELGRMGRLVIPINPNRIKREINCVEIPMPLTTFPPGSPDASARGSWIALPDVPESMRSEEASAD